MAETFLSGVTKGKDSGTIYGMGTTGETAWGPIVEAARKKAGLTQDELATRAEISTPTVRRIEQGLSTQGAKLMNVLRALGLIDDLANPDITLFLAEIRPLLAQLNDEARDRFMPALVAMVANALAAQESSSNVIPFPGVSDPMPTMEELEKANSAAFPNRKDVEGDEETPEP